MLHKIEIVKSEAKYCTLEYKQVVGDINISNAILIFAKWCRNIIKKLHLSKVFTRFGHPLRTTMLQTQKVAVVIAIEIAPL